MMERRPSVVGVVALVFVTSLFSFYAGAAGLVPQLSRFVPGGLSPQQQQEQRPPAGLSANWQQIQQVQEFIQRRYVDQIETQKLTQGALKGMVEATGDKYSSYFPPAEYKEYLGHFQSHFFGIGVYVETAAKTGLVTVVSPIKGSPGEKAGLKSGDSVINVDGADVTKMALEQAIKLIKGPAGTRVKLTVKREGVAEPLQFEIVRAKIEFPTVEHKMLDTTAGIGYIQLKEFNEQVGSKVGKAIDDLKSQGMTRLVLDLRMNPGGLLDEAVNVASHFVPAKQPVVHIVSRGSQKETHVSKAKTRWEMPLVVLVDGYSASASEIVAGALKDQKIGVLLGAKTFGKGSVQSFYDLPEENGGVKLTTARYLTAGGNSIHEKGIEPDVVVENPQKVLPGDPGDVQLQEAVKYIKTMKR